MQTNQLFQRNESAVKAVKKSLTSMAKSYREGDYLSPHSSIKKGKETITKQSPKHTGTAARLALLSERLLVERQDSDFKRIETNDLSRTVYFPGLNFTGSITEISMWIAGHFRHSKTNFDTDAAQFGIAAFLLGLLKLDTTNGDTSVVITGANVNVPGKLVILKGFEDFAKATTEEAEKAAIDLLYRDFVVGIFDSCEAVFSSKMRELVNGPGGIGIYNSSPQHRNVIVQQLVPLISHYGGLSNYMYKYNVNGVDYYPSETVDRILWLKDKGVVKASNPANDMDFFEIPALAKEVGVLTDVYALVPAKLRKKDETSGLVYYPLLNLNPALAYKMAYETGISVTVGELDVTAGQGEIGDGKRKVLSNHEAVEHLSKHFANYFDASSKGVVNMLELMRREKFIEISSKTDVSRAQGFQLTKKTQNTALLYPDMQPPAELFSSFNAKETFLKNPDLVFRTIMYCLGFTSGKVTIAQEQIQQVVKQLYAIFGKPVPATVNYNVVTSKQTSGFNGIGVGVYGMPQIQAPVHQVPVHHQHPTAFPSQHVHLSHGGSTGLPQPPVMSSTGGEI